MNRRTWCWGQKVSALIFAVFLTVHLLNVGSVLGGWATYEAVLSLARAIYAWPPVELVLASALIAHVIASLSLWKARPSGLSRPWVTQVTSLAGFLILLFIPGHVIFMRIAPPVFGFVPNFDYLWVALQIWPTLFISIYALLGTAGAYHLLYGLKQFSGGGLMRRGWAVLCIGVSLLFLVVPVQWYRAHRSLSEEEIVRYLEPYAKFTPWLVDAAEEHPYIRLYRARVSHRP